MTQLLASGDAFGSDQLNAAAEEVMLSCVKPLGAWYAENEVEGGAHQRDMLVKALANGLALCDGVYKGERNEVEVSVCEERTTRFARPANSSNISCSSPRSSLLLSLHNRLIAYPSQGDDSDDEPDVPEQLGGMAQEPLFFLLPALAKIFNCRDDDSSASNEFVSEAILKPTSPPASRPKATEVFLRFLSRQLRRRPRASIENIMWCADVLEGASKHVDKDEKRALSAGLAKALGEAEASCKVFVLRAWFYSVSRHKTTRMTDEDRDSVRRGKERIPRAEDRSDVQRHHGHLPLRSSLCSSL